MIGARNARLLALAALAAAVVTVVVVVRGAGGDDEYPHELVLTVREAVNVIPGQYVREAGRPVGIVRDIDPVDGGRKARLVLAVGDEAWPLPRDTRFRLRWGGTANFSSRYILIERGKSAATWPDGASIPRDRFVAPVEFDELLRTFPERVRRDVTTLLETAGPTAQAARDPLRRALAEAPPAVDEARSVLDVLDAEHEALGTLIRAGDRVLAAVIEAEPGMRELLTGAAGTFQALAAEERSLRETLDGVPGALSQLRSTLRRAEPTLGRARSLTARIRPGVAELRRTAQPLDRLLRTVGDVGPSARSTLASLRRAVPNLDRLLDKTRALAPQLERIGRQGKENLRCIRPYTPDMNAFFTNWGDYFSGVGIPDKAFRAQVMTYVPAAFNAVPYTSADAKTLFQGLEYGFPRPPGTNAGQPWFLPECGAGPEALDPSKDPEMRIKPLFTPPPVRPLAAPAGGGGR